MLRNTKAVIFDLDGTLIDSMWLWESLDQEYLGRFGISLPEDLHGTIEGMSFSETALYFKERFQIPDSVEAIKQCWNQMAWEKYEKEVPLKSGVQEFLEFLKEKQIPMAIATSNSRKLAEMVTRVHGIHGYFSAIVTSCEVEKGKPAPDVYLQAARELRAVPDSCLVFEDVVQGILAGKNAGMRVCAVEDEYSDFQKKEKRSLADYYIHTYGEILEESRVACDERRK